MYSRKRKKISNLYLAYKNKQVIKNLQRKLMNQTKKSRRRKNGTGMVHNTFVVLALIKGYFMILESEKVKQLYIESSCIKNKNLKILGVIPLVIIYH